MKEKKTMLPPPWIAYPEIERYSIGWRMGYGEEYICRWGGWWETLTEKEFWMMKEQEKRRREDGNFRNGRMYCQCAGALRV